MSTRKLTASRRGANPEKLTVQQQMFIEAFFADRKMNAANAAKVAGYDSKSAPAKLLANPTIKAIIQKRMQEIFWEHAAERQRILRELMAISFANPQDLLNADGTPKKLHELPQEVARSISNFKVSYGDDGKTVTGFTASFHPKLQAVELLMRHLGMFEAVQHEVKHSVDWDSMVMPHALGKQEEEPEVDEIEQRIIGYQPQQIVIEAEETDDDQL